MAPGIISSFWASSSLATMLRSLDDFRVGFGYRFGFRFRFGFGFRFWFGFGFGFRLRFSSG